MILYTPIQLEESQSKRIFESKCSINSKVCKLVIDSCSYKTLVSKRLVDHFKLKTQLYPNIYNIGWIKKGPSMETMEQYKLSLSLEKT